MNPISRFPEFINQANWRIEPLSKLAKRRTQKNTTGENKRVLTNSAEYGVVDQRAYFDKDIANQSNLGGYYIVEYGDYVYNPRISITAPVGPISKNNLAIGVMSPLYTVFRFNSKDNDFYAHYFKSTGWHYYMRQASSTGARHDRMAISNNDFMAMPLPVTSSEEQEKITACLSSIEELIKAEATRLNMFKTHKKGLVQQLFPADDETLPKLRFPKFRDAGDWQKNKLNELLFETKQRNRELKYSRQEVLSVSGEYGCVNQIEFMGRSYAGVSVKDYHIVETRDIVYTKSPLKNNPFGIIKENKGKSGIVSTLYAVYRATSKCYPAYLDQYFSRDYHLNSYLQPLVKKGPKNDMKVNNAVVLSGKILVPKIEEQKKIADCLFSLDELIIKVAKNLEILKIYKKGLIQQILPLPDKVTT